MVAFLTLINKFSDKDGDKVKFVAFLENFKSLVAVLAKHSAKVSYEPPIEGGKSMRSPYIMNTLGGRPRSNGLHLALIHTDPIGSHHIP